MTYKEMQKQEAIKRMKYLKMNKQCIKALQKENEVWKSEFNGILYEVTEPEIKEKLKELEDKNFYVYHIIKTETSNGCMYSFLYVSETPDDWALDWDDLTNYNEVFAYVWNVDDDIEEIGMIEIEPINSGLIRKY